MACNIKHLEALQIQQYRVIRSNRIEGRAAIYVLATADNVTRVSHFLHLKHAWCQTCLSYVIISIGYTLLLHFLQVGATLPNLGGIWTEARTRLQESWYFSIFRKALQLACEGQMQAYSKLNYMSQSPRTPPSPFTRGKGRGDGSPPLIVQETLFNYDLKVNFKEEIETLLKPAHLIGHESAVRDEINKGSVCCACF